MHLTKWMLVSIQVILQTDHFCKCMVMMTALTEATEAHFKVWSFNWKVFLNFSIFFKIFFSNFSNFFFSNFSKIFFQIFQNFFSNFFSSCEESKSYDEESESSDEENEFCDEGK